MNVKIDEILKIIDLTERSSDSIKSLSKGMKQRLSLGKTMVFLPKAMILDEPFAALDVEGQFFLIDYINKLKSMGTTILISSHDLGHLQKICDSVLFINRGVALKKMSLSEFDSVESAYRDLIMDK
jgi:ABC-2 type transport system ATP-binding protein